MCLKEYLVVGVALKVRSLYVANLEVEGQVSRSGSYRDEGRSMRSAGGER